MGEAKIKCFVSKPDSHKHFWPMIDAFVKSTTEDWPMQVVEHAADHHLPVLCFGVYMSRMDSNITEALDRVEGYDDVYVILIDNVVNTEKRKHDLFFYERTKHKVAKGISIIFVSGSTIDMSKNENVIARKNVEVYILQHLDYSEKQIEKSVIISEDSETYTKENALSDNADRVAETSENMAAAIVHKPKRMDHSIETPWRTLKHPFTIDGRTAYQGIIMKKLEYIEYETRKVLTWQLQGSSIPNFIKDSSTILKRKEAALQSLLGGVHVVNLQCEQQCEHQTRVGHIICMPASEFSQTGVSPIVQKLIQQKEDKHVLLVIYDIGKLFPQLDHSKENMWHNKELGKFVYDVAQQVRLPRNNIFPVYSGERTVRQMHLLNAWDWICKVHQQYDNRLEEDEETKFESAV